MWMAPKGLFPLISFKVVREPNQNFRSSVAPSCEKDSGSFLGN